MKYLTLLLIFLLSGCVHHSHESRYNSPYLLIWEDTYRINVLSMHSLEECLVHGHRMPYNKFKCIPEREYRGNTSNVRIGIRGNIRL